VQVSDVIFREYDIRGVVGDHLNGALAFELGCAYGSLVKSRIEKQQLTVAVGRDCRVSGPELTERLVEGIRSTGVNVIGSGMGPTPQLYFTVFHKDLDGGIQVTGSHNPGDQNGFKMMCGRSTLSGVDILELKRRIQEEDYQLGAEEGSLKEFDAASAYIADLIERSKPHVNPDRKLKIVVDAGNGVGGMIGPAVLRGLGCEVVELFCEPDGSFPNHHPDPTVVENLADIRRRVVEEKADVGIAWDGDADRIGVVDERGEVLFGDMLMVIYGRSLAQEINRPIVIGDVKCSELMFSELKKAGAQPVMWKTGHSLIKKKLKELDAHLAGEMSGHIFFSHRFFGFDDALHASARLIEILSKEA